MCSHTSLQFLQHMCFFISHRKKKICFSSFCVALEAGHKSVLTFSISKLTHSYCRSLYLVTSLGQLQHPSQLTHDTITK